MTSKFWNTAWQRQGRRTMRRPIRNASLPPSLERLGDRIAPAISASFSPRAGILSVLGDTQDNTIVISRDAGGNLLVNGGAVTILGGTPTVANTTLIQVLGLGGNDQISLDEANGALPAAQLFGGAGDDTLMGGSGNDLLLGQEGNDTLLGKGGTDILFGATGDDVLTGGDGDDQAFGQSGNDRMIWNPGDDTDLNEGGDGADTVEVNGGNGAEVFTVSANGTRVRFDRVDPAPFALDIGTTEKLVVNANGGDDKVSAGNGLAGLIQITMDGGDGNDVLNGGDGADTMIGGAGDDFVDGNRGDDTALLGDGNDVFQWDPGDGNDTIEGQAGTDKMLFNGAGVNENIDVSANGTRVRFFRDVATVTMDLDDVEAIDFNALGGADNIVVNDVSGTDLVEVNVNLAGALGGDTGDSQTDTVIVNGTSGNDIIDLFGSGTSVAVVGLQAQVNVINSEGANDSLIVQAQGGNDGVTASTLVAGIVKLTIDGGTGNDVILGSRGADLLRGGDGDDFIDGQQGDDVAEMGAGDDVFQWDPGDGNDKLEGQEGTDMMLFFGSGSNENIDISANAGRVRFFRDVGTVTMDLDDVERIDFRALGGTDSIVVGDLSGTDTTLIGLDLRGPEGGGDGQADTITVNGTQGNDSFGVAGDAGGLNIFGLHTNISIFFQEQANDHLTLNALGGADVVDAKSLEADGIQLTIDGGDGNDVLNGGDGADTMIGGAGDDFVDGNRGNDTAVLGDGNDTFQWDPGDGSDVVEGGAGTDKMVFNGSGGDEVFELSANGARFRLFRNVGNIVMDTDDVETIDVNALGGIDSVTVGDLTGTDVTTVNIDLAGTPGGSGGDNAQDTVIVLGSVDADGVQVIGDAGGVSVLGLAARVNITHAESPGDSLIVRAGGGGDVVDASGLSANAIALTLEGGAGDDVLIGSPGNDTLRGDDGDDVLIGGGGTDTLDGGAGDDITLPS